MPSKRCATSAKGNGNCSSAAVTDWMASQSRCEIQVQASQRRISTACSRLSIARNRTVWDLGCRSAGRLSKHITDDWGRALTCHVALSLALLRRLIRPPHREWSTADESIWPARCEWECQLPGPVGGRRTYLVQRRRPRRSLRRAGRVSGQRDYDTCHHPPHRARVEIGRRTG